MEEIIKFFCIPFKKKEQSEISKREIVVKDLLHKIHFTWRDFQNLLFWEIPFVSFLFFLTVTGIFWMFLLVLLKKIALIIIIIALPLCINEVRDIALQNLRERYGLQIINQDKKLPFTMDGIVNSIANIWILCENHYNYLHELKESSSSKLSIWLGLYISIPLIMFAYLPVANILYSIFICLYFFPLTTYTNLIDVLLLRLCNAFEPMLKHWKHNQTKRRRDTGKTEITSISKILPNRNDCKNKYSDHDSEDDLFLPAETYYNKKMLKSAIPNVRSATNSHNDISDDGSSDFDQDSFIPSENLDLDDPMPSMSQFDSMMEPLNDEFHAGLKFKDSFSSSQFGLPKNYKIAKGNSFGLTDTDTDNEIDELPLEETDNEIVYATSSDMPKSYVNNESVNEIGDYEMLEKSEVLNVTDEELNEHLNVSKNKVSTFLGY